MSLKEEISYDFYGNRRAAMFSKISAEMNEWLRDVTHASFQNTQEVKTHERFFVFLD